MKELNMLVWITQLGMGVAMPLVGFIWLGIWLKNRFSLGAWCVILFCVIGLITAFVSSIIVIKFLMRYIKKHDFKVFGWYRIALGLLVLLYFLVLK